MTFAHKRNTLSLLIGVLAGSQSALALPPSTPLPDRDHTIYLAGELHRIPLSMNS